VTFDCKFYWSSERLSSSSRGSISYSGVVCLLVLGGPLHSV